MDNNGSMIAITYLVLFSQSLPWLQRRLQLLKLAQKCQLGHLGELTKCKFDLSYLFNMFYINSHFYWNRDSVSKNKTPEKRTNASAYMTPQSVCLYV